MSSTAEGKSSAKGTLPAVMSDAPQPPAPAERLDMQPEDAHERFAFALWNAGRKDEALAFLEEQIARQKGDSAGSKTAPPVTIDVTPSERPPVPKPPLPLRPFLFGAGALVLAILLVWPVFKGVATFGGWSSGPETALLIEDRSAENAGAGQEADAGAEIAAAEIVRDVTPASVQAAPPTTVTEQPIAEVPALREAESPPPEPNVLVETAPTPVFAETPDSELPPRATDIASAPLTPSGDGVSETPATLASLADDVLNAARLPRPRPEPSAETVAALNAPPPPTRPTFAQGGTVQPSPFVVPAPPTYQRPPRPSANEPRRLTIIGRVGSGNVPPQIQVQRYGTPWAPARRYPQVNVYPYQPLPWGASPPGY